MAKKKIVSAISDEEQEFLQSLADELYDILDWHKVEKIPLRPKELGSISDKRNMLIKLFGLKGVSR